MVAALVELLNFKTVLGCSVQKVGRLELAIVEEVGKFDLVFGGLDEFGVGKVFDFVAIDKLELSHEFLAELNDLDFHVLPYFGNFGLEYFKYFCS